MLPLAGTMLAAAAPADDDWVALIPYEARQPATTRASVPEPDPAPAAAPDISAAAPPQAEAPLAVPVAPARPEPDPMAGLDDAGLPAAQDRVAGLIAAEITQQAAEARQQAQWSDQRARRDAESMAALAELLQLSGNPCPALSRFQILAQTKTLTQLKVQCVGAMPHLLTLRPGEPPRLVRVDGLAVDFASSQGRVIDGSRAPASRTLAQAGDGPAALEVDASPAELAALAPASGTMLRPAPVRSGWDKSRLALVEMIRAPSLPQIILFNMALLGLLLFAVWRLLGPRQVSPRLNWNALSSDQKTLLQLEAEKVAYNVFRHHHGFYIARSDRGRRRAFRSRVAAMLYANFGLVWRAIG